MKKWSRNPSPAPLLSVVIASYNNPRALSLCLEGYARQSTRRSGGPGVQMILADDGSPTLEVEQIFGEFADRTGLFCTFLQQDHKGWGKPRMLNWSILAAQAGRIVFTDGDCIPHRHFLAGHLEETSPDAVLCGRRVDVMQRLGPTLTLEHVRNGALESPVRLTWLILMNELDFGEQGFYLPRKLAKTATLFSKNASPTLVGSNFSIDKNRLMELNGFDESFVTPGIGEDTDLERRIKLAGLRLKWITYRAIQFHLWHPLTAVGERTHQTFRELQERGVKTAVKGVKELAASGIYR